jgi:stage II sporulation protein D
VDGDGREIELEAENFRLAVDPTGQRIKSTWFEPIIEEQDIILNEGHGFGHGLGMCQYGADGMARAGAKAGTILRYYYPKSRLSRAYE